jgi:hypothetical protein
MTVKEAYPGEWPAGWRSWAISTSLEEFNAWRTILKGRMEHKVRRSQGPITRKWYREHGGTREIILPGINWR